MRTGFYAALACSAYAYDFAEVEAHALVPQIGDALYDAADLFMQVSSNEPVELTNLFTQVNSLVDSYIDNMPPAEKQRFDNMYAEIRNLGYDWLGQIDAGERQQIGQMLTQTEYGNWILSQVLRENVGEEITNFFSQYASEESSGDNFAEIDDEEWDADWEDQYLAQINAYDTDM